VSPTVWIAVGGWIAVGLVVVLLVVAILESRRIGKQPQRAEPAARQVQTRGEALAEYEAQWQLLVDSAYRELLGMVLGDRRRVDRLIAYESSRNPAADQYACIRKAIEVIRSDIRRASSQAVFVRATMMRLVSQAGHLSSLSATSRSRG
jgi:hypothetical protein